MAPALHAQASLPPVFTKKVPDSFQDLQQIESHVQGIIDKVLPCTVCLRIGQAQGSGVIINRQGYILTAGHVSGPSNKDAVIILHDGRRLKGKTLGANHGMDSGMVQITEEVDFPHARMAKSAEIKRGQWCLSLGHPGGYKPERAPVVRLGRVQEVNDQVIVTDCTLVGGDSGGPLFDMHGHVIGIHSRIGGKVSSNLHVPVDTYQATWQRLAAGEVWGDSLPFLNFAKPPSAYLGIQALSENMVLKIIHVSPDSPAEKAGLRLNDTILKIDDHPVSNMNELSLMLKSHQPGTQITIHIQRGTERVMVLVVLGKRSS